MGRREILATEYGEMLDLIACQAVYNGLAEEAEPVGRLTYDETLEVM